MNGSLNRLAARATTHCMTGCAIGEVLGLVIATAMGWGNIASIALAVVLAFFFGYALTMWPLLAAGMSFARASVLALAADTASITVMEIVDNAIMLVVPGAMNAGLSSFLFWGEPRGRAGHRLGRRVSGQPLADHTRPRPRRSPRAPPGVVR